jgi:hypothetical protein
MEILLMIQRIYGTTIKGEELRPIFQRIAEIPKRKREAGLENLIKRSIKHGIRLNGSLAGLRALRKSLRGTKDWSTLIVVLLLYLAVLCYGGFWDKLEMSERV